MRGGVPIMQALALVFAELTDCRPLWKQALEGWNVEQSLQVLEWQAEARREGELAGRREGELAGRRADLLRALRLRFKKKVPAKLAAAIEGLWLSGQLCIGFTP